MATADPARPLACHPACAHLMTQYIVYLRDVVGLAPASLTIRRSYLRPFLTDAQGLAHQCEPAAVAAVSPYIIRDFLIATGLTQTRAIRIHTVSSIRSFLRFAHVVGLIPRDLTPVIPVVPVWRLERLPRHLEWEEVERLLTVSDRTDPSGRRTYAVLQLVATYGVRIGQVIRLHLGDIDWTARRIHFRASKHGKPVTFGLTAAVADALLPYLEDRGRARYPEVFLTIRSPRRPLGETNNFRTCLLPWFRRAGIIGRPRGAHVIRHAVATRLVNQGTSIKAIADILGHRSIETTRIYAKVDVVHLRQLALDWPEAALAAAPPAEAIR